MVRYTFAVRDLHPLLLAGLPALPTKTEPGVQPTLLHFCAAEEEE